MRTSSLSGRVDEVAVSEEDVADADTDEKELAAQQSLDRLTELQSAL